MTADSSSSSSEFESAKRDLDLFFADRVLRLDQVIYLRDSTLYIHIDQLIYTTM